MLRKHSGWASCTRDDFFHVFVPCVRVRVMVFRAAALISTAMAQQPTVDVPGLGTLKGMLNGDSRVADFLGIPYAKPPVGSLRWQPPVPCDAWEGARDATKFGFSCSQRLPKYSNLTQPQSEDCLYLST